MKNSISIKHMICAWHKCGRPWISHSGNQGRQACSPACGQALRRYRFDLKRRAAAIAPVEPLHDTELCAWWEPPYCSERAGGRDLCRTHYARAHRRQEIPPMMLRRKTATMHTVKVDSEGRHHCSVCGPITRVYGNGSCPMVQRELVLREKYGLTQEDYDERLIALGNRCSLCGGEPGATGLVVDHSHSAGHPRDLLCMSCNVLLGHLEGDMDRVRLALQYVERYRDAGAFNPR